MLTLLVLETARGGRRRPCGLEVFPAAEGLAYKGASYASLVVAGYVRDLAVPTVQLAFDASGIRAGDQIVALNGVVAADAGHLVALLRNDGRKRRITLVRPRESVFVAHPGLADDERRAGRLVVV